MQRLAASSGEATVLPQGKLEARLSLRERESGEKAVGLPEGAPKRSEAQATLDEVERVRSVNDERLRRPGRYWTMLGGFLAVFAIAPLIIDRVPDPYGYLLPPALIPLIAAVSMWGAPSAKPRYRLKDAKVSQLVVLVVACGVFVSINSGLYRAFELWWVPVCAAVLAFAVGAVGGRRLDRSWARAASRGE
ncbi:hypothetical protein [Pseudactinotalea sp. Z1732]|uniref:hypothetical protein n=1 Tax=Micrococcales TaxID=85006 RepID=UPI003C7CE629